jgi:hypothetical protein
MSKPFTRAVPVTFLRYFHFLLSKYFTHPLRTQTDSLRSGVSAIRLTNILAPQRVAGWLVPPLTAHRGSEYCSFALTCQSLRHAPNVVVLADCTLVPRALAMHSMQVLPVPRSVPVLYGISSNALVRALPSMLFALFEHLMES